MTLTQVTKRPLRALATAALTGGIVFAATAGAAQAEMLCGEREQIVDELQKTWKEDRTAIGLANNGGVLEVYSSEAGTFTLLLTMPDGKTCMLSAGEHFEIDQVAMIGDPV